MYFGTIDYDEPSPETYRRIELIDRTTREIKIFDTGCPVIDYVNMSLWLAELKQPVGVVWSSSYDLFLMDGDTYCERAVGYNGSDNPDDWVFVDSRTEPYDFEILSKREFVTFQQHRAYYKEWKSKQV